MKFRDVNVNEKLKVLFRGWTGIPHSYAMVNCFQLIHLVKYYSHVVDVYVEEMPYFQESWYKTRKLVYGEEYNDVIRHLKKWEGQPIDIVYTITFPYNIEPAVVNGIQVPKCVFYTAEFAWLNMGYFTLDKYRFATDGDVAQHLQKHPEIHFTSPSLWSSQGVKQYGVPDSKNKIISHGVDTTIFRPNATARQQIRSFYNIKDDDVLLINIGAMTQNKGIELVLRTLHELVNIQGRREFKLLLKGTGDLYDSKAFLEGYLRQFNKEHVETLHQHIIFTDKTLSYTRINDFFNAADLYVSPYLAEGFNLTVLESLAAGLPVLVPETGSTREFINDIANNGGDTHIFRVPCQVGQTQTGMKQNMFNVQDIVDVIVNNVESIKRRDKPTYLNYIERTYSWKKVTGDLCQYLRAIHQNKFLANS